MSQEPRKATDLLLDLESKVSSLLEKVGAQELMNKIISNKLNDIIARLDKPQTLPPKITVEAVNEVHQSNFAPPVDPEKNIQFEPENSLLLETSPQGFRRNSRPETYVKEKSDPFRPIEKAVPQKPNINPPGRQGPNIPPPGRENTADAIVPQSVVNRKPVSPPKEEQPPMLFTNQGQIHVQQRCVDKNGKSIFMADVSIKDATTNEMVLKTRTGATGKWVGAFSVGHYKVEISKLGTSLKDKVRAIQ